MLLTLFYWLLCGLIGYNAASSHSDDNPTWLYLKSVALYFLLTSVFIGYKLANSGI